MASGDTSAPRYEEAKTKYDTDYANAMSGKERYDKIYQQVKSANEVLTAHFKKSDYTAKEVAAIETDNEELTAAIQSANFVYGNGMTSLADAEKQIKGGVDYFTDQVNYNLNKDFKGRTNW